MFEQKTAMTRAGNALRTRIADLAAAGVEVEELSDEHLPLASGSAGASTSTCIRVCTGQRGRPPCHFVCAADVD